MTSLILKAGQYREPDAPSAETLLQPLEGRSGYVFGLWTVKPLKHTERADAFGTVLQDHLLRLASGFGARANVQHRFEQFLRALNEALADQVREGAWDIPIRNVHAFVGVACDGQIFFSGAGDLTALYLHRRPDGPYQVYNLFRGIQTEQALPSWEKAFAVVLDGDLQPGDVLCASNHDVKRLLPPEELNRYLSALPPASAAEKIRQHFPARTDMSLIILQAVDASPFAMDRAVPHADLSVARMAETERQTEQLLEDQGPHMFAALRNRFARHDDGVPGLRRPFAVYATSLFKSVLRFLVTAFGWSARAARQVRQARDRQDLARALKARARALADRAFGRFRRISRASRYLGAAAAVVVVAIVIGISAISHGQAVARASAAYEAQVAAIKDRRDQAAAALIYRDEQKAKALYEEAAGLAAKLPTDTAARAAEAKALSADIQAGLDEVRHVVNVPSPPLEADLAALGTNATGTALLNDGGTLYVFGSDKKVYRFDPAGKTFQPVNAAAGGVGAALATTSENGTDYFLDDRPGVSLFDPAHSLEQVTDLQPPAGTAWTDLALYGGRLYVLAPNAGDGHILRFGTTGSGFTQPANWIKTKSTSLADAMSMAIDGTIFVLKRSGSVVRFAQGSEVGWAVQQVDPPVAAPTRIWTDQNSNYVYVLDPPNRRLIVYAKQTGAFVSQYRSDAFANLTDFSVDEKDRVIYLLSGSKLYAITASHVQ